jgi:acyl-CoA thioesterase I
VSRQLIVAVGASNTAGYGVGTSAAFPAVLERRLRQLGLEVDVRNAGVSGEPTGAMLDRLDRDVPADAALVLFQPGSNDARWGLSADVRERNIMAIHNQLATRGILVLRVGNALEVARPGHLQGDGIHLTAAGHIRVAEALLDNVVAALAALARRDQLIQPPDR